MARPQPHGHDRVDDAMTWIKTISYEDSSDYLRDIYDDVKGPRGNIDNVMRVHSLRPHTMAGHSALYRSVLHRSEYELPAWFLETLGVYTSLTNGCDYSVSHHFEGLRRLVDDDERAHSIRVALEKGRPEDIFSGKELYLLQYARKLTREPASIVESDVARMREAGASDGEILEANQVISYFNYSNRVLNGLGVTTEGDVLGESPRT
jgi:uncharacterized peroxidase-related enzyme